MTFATASQWVGTQADAAEDISGNGFSGNRYHAASCAAEHWKWRGVRKSWSAWRAVPQDAGGSCGL